MKLKKNKHFHPFHLVDPSPWPLLMSVNLMVLMISFILLTNFIFSYSVVVSLSVLIMCFCLWWRDVIRESCFLGSHTVEVKLGLKKGMVMFIISEFMFFFSIFFSFFYLSLSPDVSIGCLYPPLGLQPLSYSSVPLLNTVLLLSSGVSLTWSHHSLIWKNYQNSLLGLWITVILGFVFSILQYLEYKECSFSIADSSFGSNFFIATGFHGLHVLIGSSFLTTVLIRLYLDHLSSESHVGYEAAAWYWHFVDVVWMFLYIFMYWWGS